MHGTRHDFYMNEIRIEFLVEVSLLSHVAIDSYRFAVAGPAGKKGLRPGCPGDIRTRKQASQARCVLVCRKLQQYSIIVTILYVYSNAFSLRITALAMPAQPVNLNLILFMYISHRLINSSPMVEVELETLAPKLGQ